MMMKLPLMMRSNIYGITNIVKARYKAVYYIKLLLFRILIHLIFVSIEEEERMKKLNNKDKEYIKDIICGDYGILPTESTHYRALDILFSACDEPALRMVYLKCGLLLLRCSVNKI